MRVAKKSHEMVRQFYEEIPRVSQNRSRDRLDKINRILSSGGNREKAKKVGLEHILKQKARFDKSMENIAADVTSSSQLLACTVVPGKLSLDRQQRADLDRKIKLTEKEQAQMPNLRWMWHFRLGNRRELSDDNIQLKIKKAVSLKKDIQHEKKAIENHLRATGHLNKLQPGWMQKQVGDPEKMELMPRWRRLFRS